MNIMEERGGGGKKIMKDKERTIISLKGND